MGDIYKELREKAREIQEDLVKHRRHLHENPEIGLELYKTQEYVISELKALGYNPKACGKTGVVALAGGKNPGKVFLIRGDMDGLPIKEEVDIDFKSNNENMHACGHDFHTSMMLGAARLLKEYEEEIPGTIKLMFQPGEETLDGAMSMIEDGLLEDPKVDAGMMMHVAVGDPTPAGTIIGLKDGVASSASDWFRIDIKGKGGHGASPNETIDPINIAAHIHIALQAINSREIRPGHKVALTIGKIRSGDISNVIPDRAVLEGTVRTYNKEDREFIIERIKEISEGTAKSFRGQAKVEMTCGCPSIINDPKIRDIAEKTVEDLFGESLVRLEDLGSDGTMNGSEDFGFLSEKIPTLMLFIGAGSKEDGYNFPAHHPKVRFDESILNKGAALYAGLAINWLRENN